MKTPLRAVLAAISLALAGCSSVDPGPQRAQGAPAAASDPQPVGPAERRGWAVVDRSSADVEGDGTTERLRIRAPEWPGHGDPAQVVVVRSGVASVTALEHVVFPAVVESADVDARPGEEVFVMAEEPRRAVTVLAWRDDRLVPLVQRGGRLADGLDHRHGQEWWVEDGRLLQTRSVQPFATTGHDVTAPGRYAVAVTRWRFAGDTLIAEPLGVRCVQRDAPEVLLGC